MSDMIEYEASCHCGAIRFRFRSEQITSGRRCNCSMCMRKGVVLSPNYVPGHDVEPHWAPELLKRYRFGDRCLDHCFCSVCGIQVFSLIDTVPDGYNGPARPGSYRINLGCIHGLDAYALEISMLDGRSM